MSRSPIWAKFAVGLAAMVPLAVPAAAGAEIAPPVEEGAKLTINGDGGADNITLTAVGGKLTVTDGSVTPAKVTTTAIDADVNAEIIVNSADGNDLFDASALLNTNYKSLVVNGGEGEDLLTGGAGAGAAGVKDKLNGDGGNDRLIGFKGADEDFGGAGNDVMVWNNGDGSDQMVGGAGVDEVEVNGSPNGGDEFTYKAGPAVGQGQFNRINLGPFQLDLTEDERMNLNGGGGDDKMSPDPAAPTGAGFAAAKIAVTLNGGTGKDALTGTDGNDVINGGGGDDAITGNDGADQIKGNDDNDTARGGNGDDTLVGDNGGDTLIAEAGEDTIIWNNGDGTDTDDGGPGFDRATANGAVAADDVFKLIPNGTNSTFERTNVGQFSLKFVSVGAPEANGGIEFMEVNAGGGNDSFTASAGLKGLQVTANGEGGNDALNGAEEPDSFFGGVGNDTINAGAGSDLADGGDGDDQLLARDRNADLVRGGAGTDRAQTDEVTVDAINGVENLDATQSDNKALLPKLGKIKLVGKGNKLTARIPVACPAAETGGCRTTLTLETAKAKQLGPVRAVVTLGSKSVKLAKGKKATVAIRLAPGSARLAKGGKLATRVRTTSTDAAGHTATRASLAILRIPRG